MVIADTGGPTQKRDAFLGVVAKRRALMGILNVTPDSFSDGGKFNNFAKAVAQGRKLVADGADILDIGAESTRPGFTPLTSTEEIARLKPLLERLLGEIDAPFSIDTYKTATARYATRLGVSVINDIWGLQKDPGMADVVAESGAGLVIMHNRDGIDPALDIVSDLKAFFDRSLKLAQQAGIEFSRIMLDPGIGFGKTKEQNLRALKATADLGCYGLPLLIGVSRKSLFCQLLGADIDGRLIGTLTVNLATAIQGARIFRVHDVAEHCAAMTVLDALDAA